MGANPRIKKDDLPANYQQGQSFSHYDVNKMIELLREGINVNRYYMDALLSGSSDAIVVESWYALPTGEDAPPFGTHGYVFDAEKTPSPYLEEGIVSKYTHLKRYTYVYPGLWSSAKDFSILDALSKIYNTAVSVHEPSDESVVIWYELDEEVG